MTCVPAVAVAVYTPVALIVPSDAFQVTDLFVTVPLTVAVNGSVPFVSDVAGSGDTTTDVTVRGVAVTVTLADADFVVSATLVAVMMCVPGLGAV